MRRAGTLTAATGCGPRDHVCWAYAGKGAWPEAVVPYLAEGAGRGERLLYVADGPAPALRDDLAGLESRDEMLASGRLRVVPRAVAYGEPDTFDPASRTAAFGADARTARAEGYTGLRIAADVSGLVTNPDEAHRYTGYELGIDAMATAAPVTVLCGYDRGRLGAGIVRQLAFVHPLRGHEAGDIPAALHAGGDGRWALTGEVDVATHDLLYTALAALPDREAVHLDLRRLRFIDVAGARALAALAVRLAPAGGVVLHHPPETLAWMIDTWGGIPGLRVVGR